MRKPLLAAALCLALLSACGGASYPDEGSVDTTLPNDSAALTVDMNTTDVTDMNATGGMDVMDDNMMMPNYANPFADDGAIPPQMDESMETSTDAEEQAADANGF